MRRTLPGARAAMLAALVFVGLAVFLASSGPSEAAPIEATWSLYARANATSFVASNSLGSVGYEIVSFAAAGPSAALETYVYGGADLTPPVPPIVSCAATVGQTTLDLTVNGAYPYAGCVYFVGVANTGSEPISVSLGGLDSHATVTCNAPGCQASDVDIIAGGRTPEEALSLCLAIGGAVTNVGMTFNLPAGVTFVCPLFVTVLQPAKESAQYLVTITPPPLNTGGEEPTPSPSPQVTLSQTTGPRSLRNTLPTPSPTPKPTDPPTATPTATPTGPAPTSEVAGARTPGAGTTPRAPSTGSGQLVQRAPGGSGTNPFAILAAGLALFSALLWVLLRRRGNDSTQPRDSHLFH